MKLHKKHANIERGGVKTESTFTIKTTAKSFEILSSGLYTDPITAVIRELSCNAYDAHTEAGKSDIPFAIHLPNALEPFFSVIDCGIGLSDDQIQGELVPVMLEAANGDIVQAVDENGDFMYTRSGGLYTTYFDSTKTDSNDYIGALGLGSKSPFSYADAFDVTSCHDGVKSMYSIFLNEEGIPSVALLGQIDTLESNGLEVRIAIKKEDFYTFESKTASILRYFQVQPTVTGVVDFEFIQLPNKKLAGDGWFVANKNWNTESFTAVQGNVPYRVNLSQITDELTGEEVQFLSKATVIAFFNIGELDVAANREEIRYDKRTKAALVTKMRQIRKDLTAEIEVHADKYQDRFWDACIELDKLSNTLFGATGSIRAFAKEDSTKNKTLKRYIDTKCVLSFKSMRQHELVRYTATSSWRSTRQHTSRKRLVGNIEPSEETVIFFNDVRVGGIGRVKEFLHNSNTYKDAIVISQFKEPVGKLDPSGLIELAVLDGSDPLEPDEEDDFNVGTELKELLDSIGNPIVSIVSVDTTAKPKAANKNVPVFKYDGVKETKRGYYDIVERVVWEKFNISDIDLDGGGLYFSLKHGSQITTNEHHINWAADAVQQNILNILKAINTANGTDYLIENVYGMSASALKKIKKEDGWFDMFDLFYPTLNNYTSTIQHIHNMSATQNVYDIKQQVANKTFISNVKDLDTDSPFRKHVEPMIDAVLQHTDVHFVEFIAQFITRYDTQTQMPDGDKFFSYPDFADYQMLRIIGSLNNCQSDWPILFDYIKQTDRS